MSEESTLVGPKSTHVVETFILGPLRPHPAADTLSLATISDTDFSYVAKTADWADKVGRLVCWVPPDSVVDLKRPEFNFLDKPRVRAKKLRGIVSYGLLVLAPEGLKPGDNAAEALGVEHYDAEVAAIENKGDKKSGVNMAPGEAGSAPDGHYPVYDVDSGLKWARKVFVEGEPVVVTEKIHGANSRYVFVLHQQEGPVVQDIFIGQQFCGSRNMWKREFTTPPKITIEELTEKVGDPERAKAIYEKAVNGFKPKSSMWWDVYHRTPSIKTFCEANPGACLYGEVYGQVGGFPYDTDRTPAFRAFDILSPEGKWLDAADFMRICDCYGVPRVPVLYEGPFDFEKVKALADGMTTLGGSKHIREGVVVRPAKERWDERLGRVCLKVVSAAYLEKN